MRTILGCAAAICLSVGCAPSAPVQSAEEISAARATELAADKELGDEAWLDVRRLAIEASGDDALQADMAGLIGRSYVMGPDRAEFAAEAVPYLEQAVAVDREAHWLLGRGFELGWFGEADAERSCKHYAAAAEAKINGAYWPVGVCYLNGNHVAEDAGKAFEWMDKSANAGDVNGMVSLAALYATGQGTEKNPNMAATWYATAIRVEGPHRAQAMRGLGAMHLFGELEGGIQQRGYAFLELAVEEGDPVAEKLLNRVSTLTEDQRAAVETHKEFLNNFFELTEEDA